MNKFVNLRMSSNFSLSDNLLTIDDIIEQAILNGDDTVSYTNKGYLFSAFDFYNKAIKNKLKPIIGLDSFIENDLTLEEGKTSRILLIAKNEEGYKELMRLNSKAALENIIDGEPAIKESWVSGGIDNIIALSGEDVNNLLFYGFEQKENLSKSEEQDLLKKKLEYIQLYKTFFPSGFFLEVVRTGRDVEDNFVRTILNLSITSKTPIVATQSALFKEQKDYSSHMVKSSLKLNEKVDRKAFLDEYGRGQYLMNNQKMEEMFEDMPFALESAYNISRVCNLKINTPENTLPDVITPNGESQDEYLRVLAESGLEEKLLLYFPDEKIREEKRPEYTERMNFELEVIKNKNFSSYFLNFVKIISKIKNKGISIGEGRGSAVGSLIVNLIGITNVDPIKHGLYFERFLNPERDTMPDIDCDIPSSHKKEVYHEISKSYNNENDIHVAQIGTFNIYKLRSAIQSVFRSTSIHYDVQNLVMNALSSYERENHDNLSGLKNLSDLSNYSEIFKNEMEYNSTLINTVKYVDSILNSPSNISRHASGIIISSQPLVTLTPLVKTTQDGEDYISSQYDKDELEKSNIVKFDILALSNLDFTNNIVDLINSNKKEKEKHFNLNDISLDDPQVYSIFNTGNTGSIFQFESDQVKKLLRDIQADSFNDIVASCALIRPSAMKYIGDYTNRKVNKGVIPYSHPLMKQITDYTYGIMIYQEQAMQAAKIIAGYSLGEGETLRRAISKKDASTISKQKERFISGAMNENNLSREESETIFEDILSFAGYGFNKAHAVSYSIIAYKNAYLKHYYKKEFFITLLEKSNKDEMAKILPDLYSNDFKLNSLNLNTCHENFSFNENNNSFSIGLNNIKGMSKSICLKIIKNRNDNGPFKDVFDFLSRVGREDVGVTLFNNLTYAGCFDDLVPFGDSVSEKRSILIANSEKLVDFSAKKSRVKKEKGFILSDLFGHEGLFKNAKKTYDIDFEDIESPTLEIPLKEDGTPNDYLINDKKLIEKEIEMTGVSLSIDPLEKYKKEISLFNNSAKLINIHDKDNNNDIFHGIIVDKKTRKTKKSGKEFLILKISDGMTNVEIPIFDEKQIIRFNKINNDEFISFKKVKKDNGYINLEKIYDWDETKGLLSRNINIAIKSENVLKLEELISKNKNEQGSSVTLYIPENYNDHGESYAMIQHLNKVSVSKDFLNQLESLLGGKQFIKTDFSERYVFPIINKTYNNKNRVSMRYKN